MGNITIEGSNDVIKESTNSTVCSVVSHLIDIIWSDLKYDNKFKPQEDTNLEFKHYSGGVDGRTLMNKIFSDQNKGEAKVFRTLLAFANTEGGGDLIIGIEEERDGTHTLKGLSLTPADECMVVEAFNKSLLVGLNGEKRIWPCDNPEKEWRIQFHPLANCPSNERRMLLHIHMNQVKGGVFASEPEAYMMTEEGTIRQIHYTEWRDITNAKEKYTQLQENDYTTSSSTVHTSESERDLEPNILKILINELKTFKVELSVRDAGSASWTKDTDHWQDDKNMMPGYDIEKYIQELSESDILTPLCPIKWLPSEQTLQKCLKQRDAKAASFLYTVSKNYYTNIPAIGMGTINLGNLFPSLNIQHPAYQLCNLFILHSTGKIDIWSVCKDERDCLPCKEYIMCAVRILKAQLLNEVNKLTYADHLDIEMNAHVWCLDNNIRANTIENMSKRTVPLAQLKTAIASMLLKGKSHIKTRLGEENLTFLTKDQLSCLLGYGLAQVNIIRGPPGSGKTIMAMHICDREYNINNISKGQILYLCRNEPLAQYIRYQNKCDVEVVTTGEEMVHAILAAVERGICCIIIDDTQLVTVKKHQWLAIFDCINVPPFLTKLVILMDSVYQNFMSDCRTELMEAIQLYISKDPHFCIEDHRELHEMLRNCRKVFSFFKSNADEYCRNRLICRHDYQGDDVSLHYCDYFFLPSEKNILISLVKEIVGLYNFEEDFVYEEKDIAVLVDSNGKGEGRKEVETYTEIFQKFYPEALVQKATQVPVDGLIIDELINFSGLETRVCFLVLTSKDVSIIENSRYKLFVASRGITRVAFLLHGDNVQSTLGKLKFSEEKQWEKVCKKLWLECPGMVIRVLLPSDWISRNIPDTNHWRNRTMGAVELRDLLERCCAFTEIQSCIEKYFPSLEEQAYVLKACFDFVIKHHNLVHHELWLEPFLPKNQKKDMIRFGLIYLLVHNAPVSFIKSSIMQLLLDEQREFILSSAMFLFSNALHLQMAQDYTRSVIHQKDSINVAILCVIYLVGRLMVNSETVSSWIKEHVQQSQQAEVTIFWKGLVVDRMMVHMLTEADDCSGIATWIDINILGGWRQDPDTIQAALGAICHKCIQAGRVNGEQLRKHLGAVNCLYGSSPVTQLRALDALHDVLHSMECCKRLMSTVASILWYDNYINTDVIQRWMNQSESLQNTCTGEINVPFAHGQQLHEKLKDMIHEREHIRGWLGSILAVWNWFELPHYQRVVLSALCQMAVRCQDDITSNKLLLMYMQHLFCDVTCKVQLVYSLQTVASMQGISLQYLKAMLRALIAVTDGEMKPVLSGDTIMMVNDQNNPYPDSKGTLQQIGSMLDLMKLVAGYKQDEQIEHWITEQDESSELMIFWLYCLTTRRTFGSIRKWIRHYFPYDMRRIFLSWREMTAIQCESQVYNASGYNELLVWMDSHLHPAWRTNQVFITTIMTAICRKAMNNKKTFMKTIRTYLGAANCLYAAPEENKLQAILELHRFIQTLDQPGTALPDVLHILWFDNYVNREVLQNWFKTMDRTSKLGCGKAVAKLLTEYMEKDFYQNLCDQFAVQSAEDVRYWIDITLDIDYWYDLPHYQRVVLEALCQAAFTKKGDAWKINKKMLSTNCQTLFCDIWKPEQLLYAVQSVVHQRKQIPGLAISAISLIQVLARIQNTKFLNYTDYLGTEPIISDTLIQGWVNTEDPVYEDSKQEVRTAVMKHLTKATLW